MRPVTAPAPHVPDSAAGPGTGSAADSGADPAAHRVVLAPMEGVIDASMRARLTALGGYARAVTEFVRVCDRRLPERVFLRLCPELERGGTTPCGVPVYVQLLGSDPAALAANAVRAAALGAPGIDLNFGCPAKTVNRSMGGSVLLQYPERVGEIVAAVRDAVPAAVPVTVKIRLGYEGVERAAEIAERVRAGGADELAVHARTKADGYRPPARWPLVAPFGGARVRINGEIWTVADARAARRASGCATLMLGRGALAAPDLAARIARDAVDAPPMPWETTLEAVREKFVHGDSSSPRHVGNRTKQWLGYLSRTYPEARALFLAIRPLHEIGPILGAFDAHRATLETVRARDGAARPGPEGDAQPLPALASASPATQPQAGSSAGSQSGSSRETVSSVRASFAIQRVASRRCRPDRLFSNSTANSRHSSRFLAQGSGWASSSIVNQAATCASSPASKPGACGARSSAKSRSYQASESVRNSSARLVWRSSASRISASWSSSSSTPRRPTHLSTFATRRRMRSARVRPSRSSARSAARSARRASIESTWAASSVAIEPAAKRAGWHSRTASTRASSSANQRAQSSRSVSPQVPSDSLISARRAA